MKYVCGEVIKQRVWLFAQSPLIHCLSCGGSRGGYGSVRMFPCKKEELGQSWTLFNSHLTVKQEACDPLPPCRSPKSPLGTPCYPLTWEAETQRLCVRTRDWPNGPSVSSHPSPGPSSSLSPRLLLSSGCPARSVHQNTWTRSSKFKCRHCFPPPCNETVRLRSIRP